jgi:hypothetical protein
LARYVVASGTLSGYTDQSRDLYRIYMASKIRIAKTAVSQAMEDSCG